MALDPEVRATLTHFFVSGDPPAGDPILAARRRLDSLGAYGPASPCALATTDHVIDGAGGDLPLRAYAPAESSGPALVYFHGGGWVSGSIESHDQICRALAGRLATVVVSVGYRLAPEHRFPAAVEDAWLATQTVAADPARFGAARAGVVVGGDSAGAGLAAVIARRARDAGVGVVGQMLVYPVVDCPSDRISYRRYAEGHGLTRAAMETQWRTYTGGAGRDDDPDAAPLRCADLHRLAPAVVVTAECDVLRDEGMAYAQCMRGAGVDVSAHCAPGVVHGFLRIAGEVTAARAAFDELIALTAAAFYRPEPQPA
jgi:acetyl esterase